jgi:hypothetical protein
MRQGEGWSCQHSMTQTHAKATDTPYHALRHMKYFKTSRLLPIGFEYSSDVDA